MRNILMGILAALAVVFAVAFIPPMFGATFIGGPEALVMLLIAVAVGILVGRRANRRARLNGS